MQYDNIAIKDVCCPFCKANEGIMLYTVTASDAANHFVLPWHNQEKYNQLEKHIKKIWNQDTCQEVYCKYCNGVFSWPFVAGDKQFYDLAYDAVARSAYPQEKWEFTRALDWVLQTVEPSNLSEIKILEIGAGNGAFLKKLIAAGVNSENISAIEYSDTGRNQLENLNLNCISCENIPSDNLLKNWEEKFDFIFMFQVLEHLDNLDSQLKFLRSCLQDKGQLVFGVPNPETVYFTELNGGLLDMPPNHISRFTESSIKTLASRNSLSLKLFEVQPLDKLNQFKEFCKFKYLRNSQSRYTVASLISRFPSRQIRKFLSILYVGLTVPFNSIFLEKIRCGSCQLFVLQKTCCSYYKST